MKQVLPEWHLAYVFADDIQQIEAQTQGRSIDIGNGQPRNASQMVSVWLPLWYYWICFCPSHRRTTSFKDLWNHLASLNLMPCVMCSLPDHQGLLATNLDPVVSSLKETCQGNGNLLLLVVTACSHLAACMAVDLLCLLPCHLAPCSPLGLMGIFRHRTSVSLWQTDSQRHKTFLCLSGDWTFFSKSTVTVEFKTLKTV